MTTRVVTVASLRHLYIAAVDTFVACSRSMHCVWSLLGSGLACVVDVILLRTQLVESGMRNELEVSVVWTDRVSSGVSYVTQIAL